MHYVLYLLWKWDLFPKIKLVFNFFTLNLEVKLSDGSLPWFKWSQLSIRSGVLLGVPKSAFHKMDWIALQKKFWIWIVDCTPKLTECRIPWTPLGAIHLLRSRLHRGGEGWKKWPILRTTVLIGCVKLRTRGGGGGPKFRKFCECNKCILPRIGRGHQIPSAYAAIH